MQFPSAEPTSQPEPLQLLWESVKSTFYSSGDTGVALLCVIVLLALTWWFWPHIKKRPGMEHLLRALGSRKLPLANPDRFSVAIARLHGDSKDKYRRLIIESLTEFPAVETLAFDVDVFVDSPQPEHAVKESESAAKRLLEAQGAQVMIWGTVLGAGILKLHLTHSAELEGLLAARRYALTEDLSLPAIFWSDLTFVIRRLLEFLTWADSDELSDYPSRELELLSDKLASLLDHSEKDKRFIPDDKLHLKFLLAKCLSSLGGNGRDLKKLVAGIGLYEEVLAATEEGVHPERWAAIQNNLGISLFDLGEHNSDDSSVRAALKAFQAQQKHLSQKRTPNQWGTALYNRATAQMHLGNRSHARAPIEEAIGLLHSALNVFKRNERFQQWATTKNALGIANLMLAQQETDPEFRRTHLQESIAQYREVLTERDLEKEAPALWIRTNHNLGNALSHLGDKDESLSELEKARAAYDAVLTALRRDHAPFEWAGLHVNRGNMFAMMSRVAGGKQPDRESATMELLDQAVENYSVALEVYSREETPLTWAGAHVGLGRVRVLKAGLNPAQPDSELACLGLESLLAAWDIAASGKLAWAQEVELLIDSAKGMLIFGGAPDVAQECFVRNRALISKFREQRKTSPRE